MQKADDLLVQETTFWILNLHCPSCLTSIESSLEHLNPRPALISCSIISHSIIIRHVREITAKTITNGLEEAGFEVYTVAQASKGSPHDQQRLPHVRSTDEDWGLEQAVNGWKQAWRDSNFEELTKRKLHTAQCLQCQDELKSFGSSEKLIDGNENPSQGSSRFPSGFEMGSVGSLPVEKGTQKLDALSTVAPTPPETFHATFSITGMTCSACVDNVTRAISQHSWAHGVDVLLLSNSASVTFTGGGNEKHIISSVEDAGYEITLEELQGQSSQQRATQDNEGIWKATFAITGMTCSACVGAITTALEQPTWIESVQVNLISNSATVSFHGHEHLNDIKEIIEELGYDATVESVQSTDQGNQQPNHRDIVLQIEGMYCHHCPERILKAISEAFGKQVKVEHAFTTMSPLLKLSYEPRSPNLNLRQIIRTIDSVDININTVVYHQPTVEERSRQIQATERKKILLRLILSAAVAIPTFIIGIVYMTLVKKTNPVRRYLMENIWVGQVSRAEWALFIMSTVVYFLAADLFHIRTLKGLRVMWRRGSPVPLADRFFRFGNMNMLISLGTSIAYFASIAQLAISASRQTSEGSAYYFDSVVFLTMFLLAGRFLEAYSKARAGDAVAALCSLRPAEALLVLNDEEMERTPTDLLEIGDVVLVPHGSSPPFDGTIIDGETNFDESSLTGESRPVGKRRDDRVYSGSINTGVSVKMRLTSISGTSMLDQIIKVVREGQTKRAPVERVADVVTSHFVPFVVFVGIMTFVVWLILGLTGALPQDYRDTNTGGWTFWSLQFSIAVFVVSCPCGIGLAGPTALYVGGGLAAKHGILVKGGGEAFQEASSLDCIVFDKTGTLTEGVKPTVTHCKVLSEDKTLIMSMAKGLEENSNHPIARSIVDYCNTYNGQAIQVLDTEEIAGKGMKGRIRLKSEEEITLLIGNENLMEENGVEVPKQVQDDIEAWKQEGMSVALLSRSSSSSSSPTSLELAAVFAISDPVRSEAAAVIRLLHRQGLEVWLLSGDNATTANSVGKAVGIPGSHIMAGVLPEQKADKIKYLQRTLPARPSHGWFGLGKKARATVAMVGDGINDAPALATADVGIAMGSGSDVALSTASFVLIKSDLYALIGLIELSRAVFKRIWLNFGWALVYNLIAIPVAAGALYAIRSGDSHVRLDPVWASLAMALSSVSVVSSSLALRLNLPVVGFRMSR